MSNLNSQTVTQIMTAVNGVSGEPVPASSVSAS